MKEKQKEAKMNELYKKEAEKNADKNKPNTRKMYELFKLMDLLRAARIAPGCYEEDFDQNKKRRQEELVKLEKEAKKQEEPKVIRKRRKMNDGSKKEVKTPVILEESKENLLLSVPPYRADVQREVDVIEEILRIYGYNNIGMSGRINASLSINPKPDAHKVQERISELLTSNGFYEGMCNSLTKSSYTDGLECFKKEAQVVLLNPLSQDLNAMRQTLLFGGLESLAYNINRKVSDVFLYEFGKTYNKFGDDYHEERRLALWVTGNKQEASWNSSKAKVDFFYIKGIVEKLLQRLGLHKGVSVNPIQSDLFSEGLAYKIRKKKVLEIGAVRSSILKASGIKQEVFYADLNWDAILELLKDQKTKYKEVSKFPEVRRDLALLVNNEVLFSELQNIALRTDKLCS